MPWASLYLFGIATRLFFWTELHQYGPGRPVVYQPEWDLRALMLRQLLQIPYVKDLVKRLRRNSYLHQVSRARVEWRC